MKHCRQVSTHELYFLEPHHFQLPFFLKNRQRLQQFQPKKTTWCGSVFLRGTRNEPVTQASPVMTFPWHMPPGSHQSLTAAAVGTYPVMEENERQQHVVDPCTDFCRRQRLQDHLQRLHAFGNQVDPIGFHSTRKEAQKARVAQGFQVLPETKTSVRPHPSCRDWPYSFSHIFCLC